MPDIEDMLGKVFFLLWDGREIRDMYRYYPTNSDEKIDSLPVRRFWNIRRIDKSGILR